MCKAVRVERGIQCPIHRANGLERRSQWIPATTQNQEELSRRNYIKWGDPNVEKIPEGEAEDIQAVAEQINAIQKAQYDFHRHCYSGMDMNGLHRVAESLILQVLTPERKVL